MFSIDVANCMFTFLEISNLGNLKNIAIPLICFPPSFSIVKELKILCLKSQKRKRGASCAGRTPCCSHFLSFSCRWALCRVNYLPKGSTWVVTSVGVQGQVRHGCDIRESPGSSLLSSISREGLCSWPAQIRVYILPFNLTKLLNRGSGCH